MSVRKIKQVLKKNGYQVAGVEYLRGSSVCESEWVFQVTDFEKEMILEHGADYFVISDFSSCNELGGNAEDVMEILDNLPELSEIPICRAVRFVREHSQDLARKLINEIPAEYIEHQPDLKCIAVTPKGQYCMTAPISMKKNEVYITALNELLDTLSIVEHLNGIDACLAYITLMNMNKNDSILCPKTGKVFKKQNIKNAVTYWKACQ